MRFAFSATGGVFYHLIARRRYRTSWAPFRARVRAWLEPWLAQAGVVPCVDSVLGHTNELIVFGPSAGWTLPLDLFAGFSRVIFVEPDPIARFVLKRRLPRRVRAEFVSRADLLPWTSKASGEFDRFLSRHPQATVLFSNVLGQIPLIARHHGPDMQHEFLQALAGRRWASYHDLYSGSASGASLTAAREPSAVFASGSVTDHETAWLSESTAAPASLALWPLTDETVHVIEFVSSAPAKA